MMTKMEQIIEWVREDVNEEDSVVWSFFNNTLQFTLYVVDILTGLPFLFYVLFSFGKLT